MNKKKKKKKKVKNGLLEDEVDTSKLVDIKINFVKQ